MTGCHSSGSMRTGNSLRRAFAATVCTLGTLSAMMAQDRYFERENPWFDLFRVDRRPFHVILWRYVKENLDYLCLPRNRFARAETDT